MAASDWIAGDIPDGRTNGADDHFFFLSESRRRGGVCGTFSDRITDIGSLYSHVRRLKSVSEYKKWRTEHLERQSVI